MAENKEEECAAITKVTRDSDCVSLVAYWGEGIAITFKLKADPRLSHVKPNDMVFFTKFTKLPDGTTIKTIFGDQVQNDRIYVRLDESTGAGFYADLKM